MIQTQMKKVVQLSERECMFRFFDVLGTQYTFHQERFHCALGVSFSLSYFKLEFLDLILVLLLFLQITLIYLDSHLTLLVFAGEYLQFNIASSGCTGVYAGVTKIPHLLIQYYWISIQFIEVLDLTCVMNHSY